MRHLCAHMTQPSHSSGLHLALGVVDQRWIVRVGRAIVELAHFRRGRTGTRSTAISAISVAATDASSSTALLARRASARITAVSAILAAATDAISSTALLDHRASLKLGYWERKQEVPVIPSTSSCTQGTLVTSVLLIPIYVYVI